jgi:hypothetical protein
MKFLKLCTAFIYLLLIISCPSVFAQDVKAGEQRSDGQHIFWMNNEQIKYSVVLQDNELISDRLEAQPDWSSQFGTRPFAVETDANFALQVMWTGWRAPGKVNNAENPVIFSKEHFRLEKHDIKESPDGCKEIILFFKGIDTSFELLITYQLEPEAFYIMRKVAIADSGGSNHFLQWLWPLRGLFQGDVSVIKAGGFGQPIAFQMQDGGVFFGLEYPTSENYLKPFKNKSMRIGCGQEIGERITTSWIESEWVVEGLSPNSNIKLWFWKYIDRIRVAPLKPYLLYNTWYDVRAPEIVKSPAHVMNEKNLLRIIELFQREMIEKHDLALDAFVLDDGWDVYKSDWALSREQFPHGLAPISDKLKEIGAQLGIWLGPIGGYSNRKLRIEWMKENGYEMVGDQLCLAGKRYHQLFKNRVVDFVRNSGVGYYKWDGIQFSCSEPDHGHPVGIYSRRAVMEALIDICQSVRAENPNIFLNITSGTWLSPWWVKYANTIWMQGQDYGYANVPSISRRDAAITYRDYVLFDDLKKNNFWFPLANLMTHGIIKGHLQKLGGEEEPLDKFIDNALLYFARGVAMWELYISPDLLTEGEWNALAKSIRWAKDRFDILRFTEVIGGDPGERLAYGYAHFSGEKGIIAVRNPFIEPQTLKIGLSSSLGLSPAASSLVLERVYPTRWNAPELYSAGETVEIALEGYETAVYEVYPLEQAEAPLLADVIFDSVKTDGTTYTMKIYDAYKDARLLNPDKVKNITYAGKEIRVSDFLIPAETPSGLIRDHSVTSTAKKGQVEIKVTYVLEESSPKAILALLLEPGKDSSGKDLPEAAFILDGKKEQAHIEEQKGLWAWHKINVTSGQHTSTIKIEPSLQKEGWEGGASVWLICQHKQKGKEIRFELVMKAITPPLPPHPWPPGEFRKSLELGDIEISIPAAQFTE